MKIIWNAFVAMLVTYAAILGLLVAGFDGALYFLLNSGWVVPLVCLAGAFVWAQMKRTWA
jgi:hypothetical protein